MPFIRDITGRIVIPAKTKRTLRADFLDGALPPWLSASAGTVTFNALPAVPYVQVASAAVIGATAGLQGPELTLSQFRAVHFKLYGLRFVDGASTFDVQFGIDSVLSGARVKQLNATADYLSTYERGNGGGATLFKWHLIPRYDGGSDGAAKYANLEALMFPVTKEVFFLENGHVVFDRGVDLNINTTAPARCNVSITNIFADASHLRLDAFEIDLWS